MFTDVKVFETMNPLALQNEQKQNKDDWRCIFLSLIGDVRMEEPTIV